MSVIDTRHEQMFPVFDADQIATARRFASGPPQTFAPDDAVYEVGELGSPVWLVIEGEIVVGCDRRTNMGVKCG